MPEGKIFEIKPVHARTKTIYKPAYYKSDFSVSGPFYRILYILFSLLAIAYNGYFFSVSLLYVFIDSKLLEQVMRAVRKGGWFLLVPLILYTLLAKNGIQVF